MTITTKDVETRLRAALEATIPQLLPDDTQQRGSTEQPATRDEELLVLAPARSEAGESRSVAAGWRLIGAAAAGVMLVGGLAIAQRQQGDPAPVAQAPTPSATAVPAPPVTVADLPGTGLRPDDLIATDAVVCVDAGASERAVRLCLDELGGDAVIEATRTVDESFLMPIDPTDPSHVADATALGNELSIPIVDFNLDYLPVGVSTNPASTIYLVLGRNDVPYAQ